MAVAVETKPWTVEDLYRIPDDENRYEVLHGELLVTPPAGPDHDTPIALLLALLVPYVDAERLGFVFANSALERDKSFLIPDLLVRQPPITKGQQWSEQAIPILVVEVRSPSTWNRDRTIKRRFYLDVPIPEYWMVDPQNESVTVVRPGEPDREVRDVLVWHPQDASEPLEIAVSRIFHPR